MKHLIASMLVGLAVSVLPAAAAEKPSAKPAATGKYSMDPKGRFHRVHEKKVELECKDCHKKDAPDLLVVSNGAPRAKDSPGPVVRSACRKCHKEGETPAFYGK